LEADLDVSCLDCIEAGLSHSSPEKLKTTVWIEQNMMTMNNIFAHTGKIT